MTPQIPYWPGKPMRVWPGGLYNTIIKSPDWVVEPKLDGWRCLVEWATERVRAWTRHGKVLKLHPDVQNDLERLLLRPGTVIDGELLGPRQAGAKQRFVAFDVPSLPDLDYDRRRLWLEHAAEHFVVPQLPSHPSSFIAAVNGGYEGIVIKRRASLYPYALGANPRETHDWLKVKVPTFHGQVV